MGSASIKLWGRAMNISTLREFVHLAQTRNFTRTSKELYISQSTLSRHISALEEELGVTLIDRDRSHFALTPAGEVTLTEFRKILKCYEDLLGTLAEKDKMMVGSIDLGFLYYDMDSYVSKIRSLFKKRYPKVRLALHSGQPSQLEAELFSGECDAVIDYGADGIKREDVDTLPFLKIPYYLFYPLDHRFAKTKGLSPEDLDGEKLVVPNKPFQINHVDNAVKDVLRRHNVQLGGTVPIENYDEVPWVMGETGAVYLAPMANPKVYCPNAAFQEFLPSELSTHVSLVWLASNDNPALQLLSQTVRSCYP